MPQIGFDERVIVADFRGDSRRDYLAEIDDCDTIALIFNSVSKASKAAEIESGQGKDKQREKQELCGRSRVETFRHHDGRCSPAGPYFSRQPSGHGILITKAPTGVGSGPGRRLRRFRRRFWARHYFRAFVFLVMFLAATFFNSFRRTI